ncbi:hypothetical protein [Ralstonia insidiosa]|uniref:hypothetical protein n=1 Tax=Ralstonia insidiosa TaxID=190721 RepID=UPI001427E8A3|nr:hypothetical protein [Ralstonia insidiosa]
MALIQNGKVQFLDANGRPLSGGTVDFYVVGTTTRKDTFIDKALGTPNPNPVQLDARGEAIIWGIGSYREVVKDANGNLIWDQVADTPASGSDLASTTGAGGTSAIGIDGDTLATFLRAKNDRVVDSRAGMRALDSTLFTRVHASGYGTPGDWGDGHFWKDSNDTSSTDNSVTTFVGADGARWKMQNPVDLIPQQANAKGDKSADDTVAFSSLYGAVKSGATIRIPSAKGDAYIISKQGSTDTQCLDFSRVVSIKADGLFSSLQPAAGTIVNTIRIKPDPSLPYFGMKWDSLALGDPYTGTRQGNNAIFIDTQTAGSNLPKAIFHNLNIGTGSVAGGAAILHVNSVANNVNGGMYCASIENCPSLKGGINLQGTGDSNTAHKNIISGPNVGIYLANAPGASLFTAVDNNITSTGGALKVDAGSRFKFLRNNCEQTGAFTGGATYMCDIAGGSGTMSTAEIRGNHFGLFSGITNSGVIHLSNTVGALVSENTILNANAGGVGIVVDANNTNTRIGPNTYGTGVVTKVVDNGVGTMGVIKTITTFANNWQNIGSTAPARFYKDILGTVHLAGLIALGTTTQGTLMFTLPVGFRPDYPTRHPVLTNNGSGLVAGEIRIDTSGAVTFWYGQNSYVSLDGICFPAAGLADTISDL